MKKFKAILALVLVACLFVTLFAACAKTTDKPSTDGGNTNTNTNTGSDTNTNSGKVDEEEIVDIVVSYLDVSANELTEWERMEAYINTISVPEIGVRVKLRIGQMGDYGTTIPLEIAGGEKLDVINVSPMGGTKLATLLGNGSLLNIKAELEEYAAEALALCGPDMVGVYAQGDALYGLPTNRLNTSNEYVVMRKDVLEAAGALEMAENCDSYSDLEAIWAKVYDYCTANNIYVIGGQKNVVNVNAYWTGDAFSTGVQFDAIGDSTNLLMTYEDGNKVACRYENEHWVDMQKRATTWKANSWIYPDTILGDDHVDNLMKQGVIFSYWNHTEIGVEVARKLSSGYDVVCPMACQGVVQTNNLANFGVAVPVTCQDVVAAVKFINLMYTDARISTVFAWGIEGEDYIMVNGEAAYPENPSNFHAQDYMMANQMLVPAWQGQGADFRAKALEANKNATFSRYLGFSIDVSEMETVVASLSAVRDEYIPSLNSGEYTDEMYQQFIDKMYAVGLQEYMDGAQTQLNAWLAANGK